MIKASLQAILKSPSAIIFTIAFPLIFILVFGSVGGSGGFSIHVADAPGADTTSPLYGVLHQVPVLKWKDKNDTAAINKALKEGDIVATINIRKQPEGVKPQYTIVLNSASSEMAKARQLESMLANIVQMQDPEITRRTADMVKIDMQVAEVREYKTIDFILPGQLSFSLLASGVFGTAFVFFNLRQTLVLKRFFATPVRREIIVVSEGIARMLFQLIGSVVIISIGYFAFHFTLFHGLLTFFELLTMCALCLMIFMGFGFIVSGLAKSDAAIPVLCNIIVMPQMLLAGTFFSIDNFPGWLQPICRALPLSFLNDALRKISYEGASLWAVRTDVLFLLIWGVIAYAAAAKLFKWE